MPVVIVSGGTAGIGKFIVKEFYNARTAMGHPKYKIATFGSTQQRVEELRQQYPDESRVIVEQVDGADYQKLSKFVNKVELRLGKTIEILVNNAAVTGPFEPIENLTEADIAKTLSVNLAGPISLASIVKAKMIANRVEKGVIVNVTSGSAKGLPGLSLYGAAKAGLNSFTAAIAAEHPEWLTAFAYNPGHVDTGMQASVRAADPTKFPAGARMTELKKNNLLVTPEETAKKVLFLSTHPEIFTSGIVIDQDLVDKAIAANRGLLSVREEKTEAKQSGCEPKVEVSEATRQLEGQLTPVLNKPDLKAAE
jgi:NAD(P)-dependent dehydrogenase (short-subunit alcohol dehydrogenase family)